jgi:diguanylate cyclase (GGDEF)-like protein
MMSWHRIKPRAFILATLVAAAVLLPIVAVPQWMSRQARLDVMREHVAQIGRLAASVVNGNQHRQLLNPDQYTEELYRETLAPLVRLHSANPDMFYVYTMVDRGGTAYFVLDTAASPDLQAKHDLRASKYMEAFILRPEYESDWLQQIAAGNTWVTPSFQVDDYGVFLTAHTPIFDSKGLYSGFVGVDFDLQYYLAQEARFSAIRNRSITVALLAALLIGFLAARFHFDVQNRLEEHYHTSIRDGLTGLLNRRGAMVAISKSLERRAASCATLLVDIDDLKAINDTHGHAAGDTVIASLAEQIRQSIREGDDCARLGGDEFMIFAPNCDTEGAMEIARRLQSRVAACKPEFSVSVGVAVQAHAGAGFDRMYHDADLALYHAKSTGKSRFSLFEPSMTHEERIARKA